MKHEINIAPGISIVIDTDLYDVVQGLDTPLTRAVEDFELAQHITLNRKGGNEPFYLNISTQTLKSVEEHLESIKRYAQRQHDNRYIDVHSRDELLGVLEEHVTTLIPFYQPGESVLFQVWGHTEDYRDKNYYYEESLENLADFHQWLLNNGFVKSEDKTLDDMASFYHVERREQRKMDAIIEDAKLSARERRLRKHIFSRMIPIAKYRPFRRVLQVGRTKWYPPMEWYS